MSFSYLDQLATHHDEIQSWIHTQTQLCRPAIYGSMDIRDSGFKAAVVDSNLYPAGFNNISVQDWPKASELFKTYLLTQSPNCRRILIIAEEHTRNKWYIDHLHTLEALLKGAGYEVLSATFLDPKVDSVCTEKFVVTLESATKGPFLMYCLHHILDEVEKKSQFVDAILYNNDLTSGLPDRLRKLKIPAYPSPFAGWYQRKKSLHFSIVNRLISELCAQFKLDPWLFSTLTDQMGPLSINEAPDRDKLAQAASELLQKTADKYREYGISEVPTLFLKADSGTYGMGVISITDPAELLDLNRKARNNLSKGKSAQTIDNFILQEGVPTALRIQDQVAEPCLYLVNNTLAGAFYRLNSLKSRTENLNSQGMTFTSISLLNDLPDAFRAYGLLAQIGGLAAGLEIQALEKQSLS